MLQNYLLTPYLNPNNRAQEQYNSSQIRTRNTVERQYGVLKRRFPALALGLRIELETAVDAVVASCILHNICISFRENLPPNEFDSEYLNNLINGGQFIYEIYGQNNVNMDRRALITNNYFNI